MNNYYCTEAFVSSTSKKIYVRGMVIPYLKFISLSHTERQLFRKDSTITK